MPAVKLDRIPAAVQVLCAAYPVKYASPPRASNTAPVCPSRLACRVAACSTSLATRTVRSCTATSKALTGSTTTGEMPMRCSHVCDLSNGGLQYTSMCTLSLAMRFQSHFGEPEAARIFASISLVLRLIGRHHPTVPALERTCTPTPLLLAPLTASANPRLRISIAYCMRYVLLS